jgi:hypothetical protein
VLIFKVCQWVHLLFDALNAESGLRYIKRNEKQLTHGIKCAGRKGADMSTENCSIHGWAKTDKCAICSLELRIGMHNTAIKDLEYRVDKLESPPAPKAEESVSEIEKLICRTTMGRFAPADDIFQLANQIRELVKKKIGELETGKYYPNMYDKQGNPQIICTVASSAVLKAIDEA